MSKYRAIKTQCLAGHTHDSKKEAGRCNDLMMLFRAGQIQNLTMQPKLDFILDGEKIFTYRPDFIYFEDGKRVVEDCKGFKTPVYRLKKRLIEKQFRVTIRET